MEDEIKIGDYIRTKDNKIRKVIKIIDDEDYEDRGNILYEVNDECYDNIFDEYSNYILPDQILKHSSNIADILKIGDIAIMICYNMKIQKFLERNDIIEIKKGTYKVLKVMPKEIFERECYKDK